VSRTTRARRIIGRPWRWFQTVTSRAIFARGQIDTGRRIGLDELGIDAPDRGEYAPSGWLFARRMLRGCSITPADVFVDIGSGQGRMVYMAARNYPFGRVIGVEIAPDLNAVARKNIDRMRAKLRCQNVELVGVDATQWEVPDDLTYVYMFNPFGGDIFRQVLENVSRSLDRRPRPLRLFYAHPVHSDMVLATGRFELVRTTRGLRRDIPLYRIDIFQAKARSGG
jgi:SAM-dependent methyltransferase